MVDALSTQKTLTRTFDKRVRLNQEIQLIYPSRHLFNLMPFHTSYQVWGTTQDNPIVRS